MPPMRSRLRVDPAGRLLAVGLLLAAGLAAGPAPSARSDTLPRDDPARGVVHRDLVLDERCGAAFRLERSGLCTFGPDPVPAGAGRLPVRSDKLPLLPLDEESSPPSVVPETPVLCDGDGESGPRVQAVYARSSAAPGRFEDVYPSIVQWAANVDAVFVASAQQTGGSRRVRFVTDRQCNLVVEEVALTPAAMSSFDLMILELGLQGFDRDDRKYLIWADASVYCGIATLYLDDVPLPSNDNDKLTAFGRVDTGCWGLSASVEAHELMHMIGAVQSSAPHSTSRQAGPGGHCTDEYDRMCYADFPGVMLTYPCPFEQEFLFDCGKDDYFSTAPSPFNYLYTHWNSADSAWLVPEPGTPGRFMPLRPARILDTRTGAGGVQGALGPGGTARVKVTGVGGVPETGVGAVALNVTATGTTAASHLTVWPPGGAPRPGVSNLNWDAGRTVANLVVVGVGPGGTVDVRNAEGSAHVVFDVAGWYWRSAPGAPGRLQPVNPSRLLDTRGGQTLAEDEELFLPVAGRGGVPAGGAIASVLNVTVANPSAAGHLTVFPDGEPRPVTSNVNWLPGQTVANRALVKLGAQTGAVRIHNAKGSTDLVLDIGGWVTGPTLTGGTPGRLRPLVPARIVDTREGVGAPRSTMVPGQAIEIQVTGAGGVPSGASAVVMNVTATATTASSYFTVWPSGQPQPVASDMNWTAGRTVPNLVVAKIGSGGRVSVYNAFGSTHLVIDVLGWYG